MCDVFSWRIKRRSWWSVSVEYLNWVKNVMHSRNNQTPHRDISRLYLQPTSMLLTSDWYIWQLLEYISASKIYIFTVRRYALHGLSHRNSVRPSDSPSVTLVHCVHIVRPTIMITSTYGSPVILVSGDITIIPKFEGGHPERGRWMRVGWVRIGDIRPISRRISETVRDMTKVNVMLLMLLVCDVYSWRIKRRSWWCVSVEYLNWVKNVIHSRNNQTLIRDISRLYLQPMSTLLTLDWNIWRLLEYIAACGRLM